MTSANGVPALIRRVPFFYGWVIVGVTFSTSMITAGISGYGLSFFVIPMSEDLGVSRSEFSAITLFRLAAIPIIPLIGLLADKREGPRLILFLGSIFAGLALIATSRVESLLQFFVVFGIIFGIAMLAMGGQLVGPAVLAKWFVRKRGRVMAISAMGISGGGLVIAPIAGWLVTELGWRGAWVVLGVGMIAVIAPAALFLMRRQPEDVGLLPDGVRPAGTHSPAARNGDAPADAATLDDAASARNTVPDEYPWTVREAVRTRAFWVLLLAQVLGLTALMPILFHQVAYIQDKGLSIAEATLIATTLAGFAVLGKVVFGLIVERVHVRWVLALAMLPAGMSVTLLVSGASVETLLTYAVIHGLTMGGFPPLMNVAFAGYFGREHMGAIRGVVTPAANIVAAISPVVAGWMWTQYGSYDIPFSIFGGAWFLGGIVVLFARQPHPPAPAEPTQDGDATQPAGVGAAGVG